MFSLLHRYGLVTALVIGFIGSTRVCVAVPYTFQGANFSFIPAGSRFSASDSASGTLNINNPPWPGTCTGLGSGAGECDITQWDITASGSPSISMDLNDIDPPSSFLNSWTLSFNATGQIIDHILIIRDAPEADPTNNYLLVESGSAGHVLFGNATSGGTDGGSDVFVTGYIQQNAAGNPWTLVPEPSTAILFLLGGLSLAVVRRRRR